MKFTPKNIAINWYKYDLSFTAELLRSYVKGVEEQIQSSIDNFHQNAKILLEEEVPEEQLYRVVVGHSGLDDETWDLKEIFEEYFPNLQRRSAFVTTFSFLENELEKLCRLYDTTHRPRVKISDLKDKGIVRSVNYLNKVIGLDIDLGTPIWEELKNVQKIRNIIVHDDGRLLDSSGTIKPSEKRYVDACLHLDGHEEVIIRPNFLPYVLDKVDEFLKIIDNKIATAEEGSLGTKER